MARRATTGRRRSSFRAGVVVAATLFLIGRLVTAAFADHVAPVLADDKNPKCKDLGRDLGSSWRELKIDPPSDRSHDDGTLEVDIEVYEDDGQQFVDWSSNIGVDAVIVKGGEQGANVYFYSPEATSDTGLHAPTNPNGKYANVSHVSFCYDGEEESDNHTDGQTDNHTDGQTDNHTDGQTDNHTDGQTDNHTDNETDNHTDGQTDNHTDNETDNHTDGQTDNHTDGQTDNHTDGQTDNHTDNETDNHTDGQTDNHTDGQTDNHTDGQTDNHTDNETDGTTEQLPPPPVTNPNTQVLGTVTQRAPLAATGSETTALAWLGLSLLVVGAGMRTAGRRTAALVADGPDVGQRLAEALERRSRSFTCRG
jgi:hypothetical protein